MYYNVVKGDSCGVHSYKLVCTSGTITRRVWKLWEEPGDFIISMGTLDIYNLIANIWIGISLFFFNIREKLDNSKILLVKCEKNWNSISNPTNHKHIYISKIIIHKILIAKNSINQAINPITDDARIIHNIHINGL